MTKDTIRHNVSPDYAEAASRVLKPEAAAKYAAGDFSGLTDEDHAAVETEVQSIVRDMIADQ